MAPTSQYRYEHCRRSRENSPVAHQEVYMSNDSSKTRVAVFLGGRSAEHDISIQSGLNALQALEISFPVMPVYIDRQGQWHVPSEGFGQTRPGVEVHQRIA